MSPPGEGCPSFGVALSAACSPWGSSPNSGLPVSLATPEPERSLGWAVGQGGHPAPLKHGQESLSASGS